MASIDPLPSTAVFYFCVLCGDYRIVEHTAKGFRNFIRCLVSQRRVSIEADMHVGQLVRCRRCSPLRVRDDCVDTNRVIDFVSQYLFDDIINTWNVLFFMTGFVDIRRQGSAMYDVIHVYDLLNMNCFEQSVLKKVDVSALKLYLVKDEEFFDFDGYQCCVDETNPLLLRLQDDVQKISSLMEDLMKDAN
jgi:hypothetical protein